MEMEAFAQLFKIKLIRIKLTKERIVLRYLFHDPSKVQSVNNLLYNSKVASKVISVNNKVVFINSKTNGVSRYALSK